MVTSLVLWCGRRTGDWHVPEGGLRGVGCGFLSSYWRTVLALPVLTEMKFLVILDLHRCASLSRSVSCPAEVCALAQRL